MVAKYGVKICFTRSEDDRGELWRDLEEVSSVEKEPGVYYVEAAAASACLARRHPYIQSMLLEKQLMEKAGLFDESLANADDTQLIFKLSYYSGYLYLDEPLVVIHIGTDNSLTYNLHPEWAARRLDAYLRVQVEMYWRLLLANPSKAATSRERMSYYCLRRAQLACATGDFKLARALGRNAVVMAVDLRGFLAGALVFFFPRLFKASGRKKFHLS